ncbi:MAG: ArsA-related P-loop ATPase [Myxococcota bacterium]|nr:ArsA-related P-loop ATPase [Myxococcota bacterium]
MDEQLLSKRFVIVVGKGGVGKSTVASTLGRIAASRGRRTVIAEFSDSASVPRLFGRSSAGYKPVLLEKNLFALCIRPEPALHEYALRKIRFESIYRLVFENTAVRRLLRAIPGLTELLVLGKAFDLEREKNVRGGQAWDLVIVDAPSTGHGVNLFRLPQVLLELVQRGPLADEARAMRSLIQDKTRTVVHLVAVPEELPVQETLELAEAVKTDLGMHLGLGFVNRVWPDLADSETRDALEEVRESEEPDLVKAIA